MLGDLLQSQHTYLTEHSSWILMKSEQRHVTNINQKKISYIKVKSQCAY